jgi:hypothetical protein
MPQRLKGSKGDGVGGHVSLDLPKLAGELGS